MSTGSPVDVIAEPIRNQLELLMRHSDAAEVADMLAACVLSRLEGAGHRVVTGGMITRVYRAAGFIQGHRYLSQTHSNADLKRVEHWFSVEMKRLEGLPGVDTVRLEYRDELDSDWNLLESVSSCTQHDRAYQ